MKTLRFILIPLLIQQSAMALADNESMSDSVHKYWVCGISSYSSIVADQRQDRQCRANTAYSDPPCREFYVEYEGANGIRPDHPFQRTDGENSTVTINITSVNNTVVYSHTVDRSGDQWVYRGQCAFYEAPSGATIHLDQGLVTGR